MNIQTQINLQEITDLILQKNEFDSFLDCSTNLANLRTLDLSQNHLQRFFFLCKDEYNLQVLNVSHNKLEYIDDNAFNDRIPKLKILDLSWNRLSIVNETMLEHFKVTAIVLCQYTSKSRKDEHAVGNSYLFLGFGIPYVGQQSDQQRNSWKRFLELEGAAIFESEQRVVVVFLLGVFQNADQLIYPRFVRKSHQRDPVAAS